MGSLPYVIFFLLLAATVLAKAVSFFTESKKHGFGATITWMALRSKGLERQEEESESSSDFFDEVEDWVGYDPGFDYDYWLYEP